MPSLQLLCVVLLVSLAPVASAGIGDSGNPRLPDVVVVASRVAQPGEEVAGTVSVIERERIEEVLADDVAALFRYEPGVEVPVDASRFGLQGFGIRGLDGNRVGVEIDGIPVADGFRVGSFSSAGRNVIDPELLERVEILRGPASTLYGSDALAGMIAFRTRSARDLLAAGGDGAEDGRRLGLRAGLFGADRGRLLSASMAVVEGDWDLLTTLARRDGAETGNRPGDGGMRANPVDSADRFGLARLGHRDAASGDWALTLEHSDARRWTDVRSLVGGPAQYATTTRLTAEDRHERERASLAWRREVGWLGSGHVELNLYAQDTAFDQFTVQDRAASRGVGPTRRERRFLMDTGQRGFDFLVEGQTQAGTLSHWQVAGLDLQHSRISEWRDGLEIRLDTGASSNVIIGEALPVRDFPESVESTVGLFWQDEITVDGSRWTWIPGLRYEYTRLDARPDALWTADNPDTPVVDRRTQRLTPKLGLRYRLGEDTQIFVQYASGFRSPPFSDLNIGLNLVAFGYRALPNPELKPESSRGLEIGLRHFGEFREWTLALYHNRYRNLIESRVNLGVDPESGLLLFQSQNRARARIEGVEVTWLENLDRVLGEGWQFHAALSWSRGRDTLRDQPINSVLPATLVAGLRWDSDSRRHGIELTGRFVAGKDDVDQSRAPLFEAPGYATLDLFYRFRPGDAVRLDVGAFNLANRRYWSWSSVRGVAPDAPDLDLYSAPGRNLSATLSLRW